MKVVRNILLITIIGSTLCADSWYTPYLQKIRSYFNPTTISYATVGAAAGGYVAHRANWNPCVGAAYGLLLGLSAEKLSNVYANMGKSEQTEPESDNPATPKVKKEYTHLSEIPIEQTQIRNEAQFKDDYEKIKQAVFNKMGPQFAQEFNLKYPEPTAYAVIELAARFDDMSKWQETYPPQATATIGSQEIKIDHDIAVMLHQYKNIQAVSLYKEILATQNPKKQATQTSINPVTQLSLKNPQKFYSDYQTMKNAVFTRFSGTNYENDFNIKYPQPTVEALIELASHFDAVPRWSETLPVSTTISIDGKKIALTGDIANIIHDNQEKIIELRQSYLE